MAKALSSMKVETRNLKRRLQVFANKSRQAHGVTLRRFVLALLNYIIVAWPVDTGRSRAGWGVACDLVGLKMPSPPKPAEAFDESFRPGEASMSGLKFQATNNVQYAPALEEGWSKQAPAGVVRLAMRRLMAELDGGSLPQQIKTVYQGLWDTGRIPTRAMQPGTGGGL